MSEDMKTIVLEALDDMKAVDPKAFFVQKIVGYTDWIVIATGTSTRHVKAIVDKTEIKVKEKLGIKAIGVEGADESSWVLIDFGDVVLHVMTAEMRDFYQLEKLFM